MRVLILAYHRVYPGYHIDPEVFDFQMRVVKERFLPLSLDEVISFLRGELQLKQDGAVITFDDGWADNFVYAYPILKKYGLPAVIFVTTGFISDKPSVRPTLEDYWNGKVAYEELFRAKEMDEAARELATRGESDQFLTWEEIRSMRDIFEIQCHGHTHAYHFRSTKIIGASGAELHSRQNWLLLSGLNLRPGEPHYESGSSLAWPRYYGGYFESLDDYRKRVKQELETSVLLITDWIGVRPRHLAWPFGEYSQIGLEVAKEMGFMACYTTDQGVVAEGSDAYALPRVFPPRSRTVFFIALKRKIGIPIYRQTLRMLRLWQRLNGL